MWRGISKNWVVSLFSCTESSYPFVTAVPKHMIMVLFYKQSWMYMGYNTFYDIYFQTKLLTSFCIHLLSINYHYYHTPITNIFHFICYFSWFSQTFLWMNSKDPCVSIYTNALNNTSSSWWAYGVVTLPQIWRLTMIPKMLAI